MAGLRLGAAPGGPVAIGARHGQERLSQAVVEEHQRRHVIAVVAALVEQHGVEPNGDSIVVSARIGRNSLYRLFGSKRGCIDAACIAATELVVAPLREAAASTELWARRLEAGIDGLLEAAAAEPQMAALCLVHSPGLIGTPLAAGPAAVQAALAALLDGGREAGRAIRGPSYREPPEKAELFVAAGMVGMLDHWLREGSVAPVAARRAEMVQFATSQFIP
jgi:AcrR family transcriptional regulator